MHTRHLSLRRPRKLVVGAVLLALIAFAVFTVFQLTSGSSGGRDNSAQVAAGSTASPSVAESGSTPSEPAPNETESTGPEPSATVPATPETEEPPAGPPQEEDAAPSPSESSGVSGKQGVTPIVSFAGWHAADGRVEVSGFVSSVLETSGSCTVRLSREGITVTVERKASASATTTDCGNFVIARDKLASGVWKAILIYESPDYYGESAPATVVVP
ncbi:hypothetical protein LWF01_11315 [Saxibacter everestensis]|uniref:Bacterial spore germination immunoglobulin-like domain-containing protein n=1 Tax=Saxibacter everestensis TaxID=2909229 RepID=A0ABY8QP28_9MICO|nr:hypothetical protein LWF01_11315 [Brevibacteriaceae bacterium ZFBP1038]